MRVTSETSLVRIAARSVNDCETDVRAGVLELREQSIDADTIAPNIIFVPDLRIDRKHVALSVRLNTEASEVNHYNRIGPHFRFETCDRACHVVARSVLNEVNVETVFTKGARQRACVVDGLRQGSVGVGIAGIPDHEGKTISIAVHPLLRYFSRATCARCAGVHLLRSLRFAQASREDTCDRHSGQYRFQTGHVWPHGVLLRSVEAPWMPNT